MRASTYLQLAVATGAIAAPLSNLTLGRQASAIHWDAGGTLPTTPAPASLSRESLSVFQLIAFNENFEVAFFQSLLDNVTQSVSGFETPRLADKVALMRVLQTVLAVCSCHALSRKLRSKP